MNAGPRLQLVSTTPGCARADVLLWAPVAPYGGLPTSRRGPVQGASGSSSGRSSTTNLAVLGLDATVFASDAESSKPSGSAVGVGSAESAQLPIGNTDVSANDDAAGSSETQPALAQPQQRSNSQRAVGFPIVPVKVAVSSPFSHSGSEAASGSAYQQPAPVGDAGSSSQGSTHDILGSEALAAALRDANGSPGRAGMVPRSPPGAHLAHIAAQGHEHTVCSSWILTAGSSTVT